MQVWRHEGASDLARFAGRQHDWWESNSGPRFAAAVGASLRVVHALPDYTAEQFATNAPKWADLIAKGRKTADDIIADLDQALAAATGAALAGAGAGR